MPNAVQQSRLKKKQRGFFHDKDPGLYDVKGSFIRANDANKSHKIAGITAALEKFGLLNEVDPVSILSKTFQEIPAGFKTVTKGNKSHQNIFWTDAGPATERTRFSNNPTPMYGGV
jgi:hypothetical protein